MGWRHAGDKVLQKKQWAGSRVLEVTAEKDHCRVRQASLWGTKGVGQVPIQDVAVACTQAGEVLHEACSTSSLAVRHQKG